MPTSKVGPTLNKRGRASGGRRRRRAPATSPFPGNAPRRSRARLRCAGEIQEDGVTLIELVLVMTIIALLSALTYPTASAGLDSLRLRTATERVVSLLNTALDRADRVQQVVEIRISPEDNAISARSSDLSLNRTLTVPAPVHIASAGPDLPNPAAETAPEAGLRRYLLYPGGTPPRISIELETIEGRKRRIWVDTVTGMLHSDLMTAP